MRRKKKTRISVHRQNAACAHEHVIGRHIGEIHPFPSYGAEMQSAKHPGQRGVSDPDVRRDRQSFRGAQMQLLKIEAVKNILRTGYAGMEKLANCLIFEESGKMPLPFGKAQAVIGMFGKDAPEIIIKIIRSVHPEHSGCFCPPTAFPPAAQLGTAFFPAITFVPPDRFFAEK